MKVVYVAKASIPSESANSVHVMKISEAFSELVDDFALIIPTQADGQSALEKSFEFYGVNRFAVRVLSQKKNGKKRGNYEFALAAVREACREKSDIIITRDPLTAFFSTLMKKEVVLDLHGDLRHLCGRAYRMIRWKWLLNNGRFHLVTITAGLKKYYHETYAVPLDLMTVLPDGYTPDNFEGIEDRTLFGGNCLNVGYCGGFLKGKGLELIYRLACSDRENCYNLYGGTKESAEKVLDVVMPENVHCKGHIPNVDVPRALLQQDILLLPNQNQQLCKGEDIGKVTSPLKMFEYMASGRVIVASDLPVLREILNESNCYFAKADDPEEWRGVLTQIQEDKRDAMKRAEKAREDVKEYSWKSRAVKMLQLAAPKS